MPFFRDLVSELLSDKRKQKRIGRLGDVVENVATQTIIDRVRERLKDNKRILR